MIKAKTNYKIKHIASGKVLNIYSFVSTELTGSRNLADPLLRSSSQFFDENHNKIDIEKLDDSEISIGSKILVGIIGSEKCEYEVISIY